MGQPINSETEAAEALSSAIAQDSGEQTESKPLTASDLQPRTELKEQAPTQSTPPEEGTPETQDSLPFETINPNELPPELQAQYKNMQAKFTQTQQRLAEAAKAYEDLDPAFAREAVDFVTNLSQDPNYALQVRESLTQALMSAGYTFEEAQAEAARTEPTPGDSEDEYGFGADEEINPKLQTLEQELADLRSWRDEQEERDFQYAILNEVNRQEASILKHSADTGRPLEEGDMSRIYDLAYSTGGNLVEAYNRYNTWRDEVLSSYIDQKKTTPSALTPVSAQGGAEPPERITELMDPRLEKMAMEALAKELAN